MFERLEGVGETGSVAVDGRKHGDGCWNEYGHRDCALKRIEELETPSYWTLVDGENLHDSLDDACEGLSLGDVEEVVCHHELPTRWVAVLHDPEDEDSREVLDFATEAEARAAVAEQEEHDG